MDSPAVLCETDSPVVKPKQSVERASEHTEMEEAMAEGGGQWQSIDQSDQVSEEMRRRRAMRLMWRGSGEVDVVFSVWRAYVVCM